MTIKVLRLALSTRLVISYSIFQQSNDVVQNLSFRLIFQTIQFTYFSIQNVHIVRLCERQRIFYLRGFLDFFGHIKNIKYKKCEFQECILFSVENVITYSL